MILERLRRGVMTSHFDTVRVRKDGTPVDVSVSISPIRRGDGTIIGASKIVRDVTERKRAEAKLRTQLARMDLLQQITRAIGERQDLRSIFQVVIRTLEDHLPADFCCVLLHDAANQTLTVSGVGVKSASLALEVAMPEKAVVPVDSNGLSRCVIGHLVYEPDVVRVPFPFPQRLAQGGLRSLVLAPLTVESEVFGVLAVARREPESFSSGECEFLRQLSEHIALASHQAQLLDALQRAYDDLRQTQQAVLQQERLRAFGEMASGVAHDINNTLSPAMIYAQLLLEREQGLGPASRGHLETIQRSINDVSETIARLPGILPPAGAAAGAGPRRAERPGPPGLRADPAALERHAAAARHRRPDGDRPGFRPAAGPGRGRASCGRRSSTWSSTRSTRCPRGGR